jgi:hypothetical protein
MGFGKLFWGILFFFDFRIQQFDVLPDIIGYILIYIGLEELAGRGMRFREAKKYALPLIILSVFDIINLQAGGPSGFIFVLAFLYVLIYSILNLLLIFNICRGCADLAEGINDQPLVDTSLLRWKLYLISVIMVPVMMFLGLAAMPLAAILIIPLFIYSTIVLILLMLLMKECERKFSL